MWACSKLAFASKFNNAFGYDYGGTTAKKVANAKDNFTEAICERLRNVTVENEDGLHVIVRYDKPEAFHFVDPPYIGSDCGHYAGSFSEDDFQRLLDLLTSIQGKFMLTMFPHQKIQEYAGKFDWTIHSVERTITASKTSRRRQEEWIVINY